jgi:hypothetical protein
MQNLQRALFTFAASVLVCSAASAAPTAKLSYVRGEGAEACADEADLKKAVAARLGYDPFRVVADVSLSISVEKTNRRFRARIRLADSEGHERGARELTSKSDDCRDLTDTMALTVSIALDPTSLTRVPDASPPPPPVEETVPEVALPEVQPKPELKVEVKPEPEPLAAKPEAPIRFAFHASGHVVFGVAQAPAIGAGLRAGISYRRFEVNVGGRFDAPVEGETSQGGSLRIGLQGGSLAACGVLGPGVFCGTFSVASISAETRNVTTPRQERVLYLGAGLRAGLRIPIVPSIAIEPEAELNLPLIPFALQVNGKTVYELAPAAVRISVGPTLLF